MFMSWVYLLLAGLGEIGWGIGLKYTEGFTKLVPSLITLGLTSGSFYLLALALRDLPLSTAYAIWTGIGTIGTFLVGVLFLHEPATAWHFLFVAMILGGLVGLKMMSS